MPATRSRPNLSPVEEDGQSPAAEGYSPDAGVAATASGANAPLKEAPLDAIEPALDSSQQLDRAPVSRTFPFARSMSSTGPPPPQASTSKLPAPPTDPPNSPRPNLASQSRPSYIRLPPRQAGLSDRQPFPSPDVTSPSGRFSVSSAESSGSRVTAPDLGGSSARYFPIRSVMYPSTSSAGSRGSRSGSTALSTGSAGGVPPESAEALLATEGFPSSPREQDEIDFAQQSFSVPFQDGQAANMSREGGGRSGDSGHRESRPGIRPVPDRRGSSSLTEGGGRSETSGYSSSFGTQSDTKPPSLDPFLSEPTTHAKIGDPDSDDEEMYEDDGSGGGNRSPRSDVQEHDYGGVADGRLKQPGQSSMGNRSRLLNPNETRYENAAREAGSTAGSNQSYVMTSRFEHKVTADGEHLILTGREGALERCEDEPIHAPGAIQAFGVLIAFDLRDDDSMVVQQVSENSGFVIGIQPRTLFSAKCFSELLSEYETDVLLDALDALDERDADETNEEVDPYIFILSGEGAPGTGASDAHGRDRLKWSCHAAIHRPNPTQQPERVILELELIDDQVNPLTTKSDEPMSLEDRTGLGNPEDYGENGINPTEDEIIESTVSIIKPLRNLSKNKTSRVSKRRAARRQRVDDDFDVVGLLSQINDQLSKTDSLDVFLKIVAGIFRELTEFDRVMVYQFDENWNGRVVAEQVDWTRTKDLFRGLSFPASDIPAQARELYKINKVRVLYDRDQPTARLCCRSMQEVEQPLDMTHCHLRAMSPIHIKYLGNMGVRASTSISITAFGDLWGLVSMHGYGRFGHRVSFRVRQLCKLLGQSVSRNIERISYASRLQARKLINTATSEQNPSGYIVAKAEDLLDLFHADFGVLSIGEEAKILGAISNSQELLALLEYLRARNFRTLVASQDIRQDFPDIDYPDGFQIVAGILVVPLSSSGNDFIVFCRKGQLQEIHWAGNPHANKTVGAGDYRPLEPRKSFKIWSETIIGKSRAWTDEEKETASVLCLVYGKFIAVWREKESALAASQLTNLLLQNASHEVRTPLNAIINYLELALDGPIQGEVRDNLVRSHAASKSLIHVINDLLDLTRTEKGNDLFLTDPFNIAETLEDAISMHREEASRRGLSLDVVENPSGTPPTVLGDRAKIRQIITNVVANALKHTDHGGIHIEWGEVIDENLDDAFDSKKNGIRIGISVSDTGHGISEQKLENIFRQLENVSTIGDRERDEHADEEKAVGLGLAVVARIVRNLDGQLQVESKVGKGSKFTFIFPFRLPPPDLPPSGEVIAADEETKQMPHVTETRAPLSRRMSTKSAGSAGSRGSRASSEIDSLIQAISTSHMNDSPPPSRDATHSRSTGSRSAGRSIGSRSTGSNQSTRSFRTAASSYAVKSQREEGGNIPGQVEIRNSATPLRASRIPDSNPSPISSPRLGSSATAGPSFNNPFFPAAIASRNVQDGSAAIGSENSPIAADLQRRTSSLSQVSTAPSVTEEIVTPRPSSPLRPVDALEEASVVEPTQPEKPVAEAVNSAEDTIKPMRVLVVEDEMVNRMIISQRLKKDGHEVVVAEHGGAAVRKFEEDRNFDVVLMDLQMPIMNGIDASKNIRRVEGEHPLPSDQRRPSAVLNRGIPIFAVTASLPERERQTIVDAQLNGWMLKPIDFKRLRTLLRGATDRKVRHQELYRPGQWERGGWLADAPGPDEDVAGLVAVKA